MKNVKILMISLLSILCFNSFGTIPVGRYQVDKIICKSGTELKLGGKFMIYTIFLDVGVSDLVMTAQAKAGDWAPFKLNCTQINKGRFTYTRESSFEGDLVNTSVDCNASAWTTILKKKLFGVESYGEFFYNVSGNELTLSNRNTITRYSCLGVGDYPIYYYRKL